MEDKLTIEWTFDRPPDLVERAIKHRRLMECFSHWNEIPEIFCGKDVDCTGNSMLWVNHHDTNMCHEAVDIVDAFLSGYFAAYPVVFQ